MEAIANAAEDKLVDSLSFKLKNSAAYISDRRSCTFYPTGSNHYSATGTKVIKILFTDSVGWLDPSTVSVMFDVKNDSNQSTAELRVLGEPHVFFKRMRILCGGSVVEDIDNYSRVHELMKILTPTDSLVNDSAQGFGRDWNHLTSLTENTLPGIPQGQNQTVMMKLCSGLFSQEKMLPIKNMPISIELEVDSESTNPIMSYITTSGTFTSTNTSVNWHIENVQVKCDVITLDNQLDNSFTEHFLSGKALPVNYKIIRIFLK